jgi:hypothetical protein
VSAAAPSLAADLDDDARRRLDRGETVVETRAVENFPWPEVVAMRRVAAAPVTVMAVYADFDGQARYMPEMVASRIVGRDGHAAFRVYYETEVPGPNEQYTLAITVHHAGDAYEARWSLISARYSRRLSGDVRVTPYDGGALVRFTSRVDPGKLGATLGSPDTAARRLRATVEALTAQVQKLATENPDRLRELTQTLSTFIDR